jgi:hypothetical protein
MGWIGQNLPVCVKKFLDIKCSAQFQLPGSKARPERLKKMLNMSFTKQNSSDVS